jgi:hypothetical protein
VVAAIGSNSISIVAVSFGFKVIGVEIAGIEKPAPASEIELIVTAAPPVDVKVTDWVSRRFSATSPNPTDEELTVRIGVAALNCRPNVCDTPLPLAVKVAVAAEETADTVAVNAALVAPAATVTVDGTVTAELLLARFTVSPPLAAATFSETVQESLPAPVIEEFVHDTALGVGIPVPLRGTVAVPPDPALLDIVNVPDAAPATAGSNFTWSVAVSLGFSVIGKVTPETLNPAPAAVAELIVSATVPPAVSVTGCDEAVFTFTLPKGTLDALTLKVELAAPNERANVLETPPSVAVSVAVPADETADTVAENAALVAPAATVTVDGTATAELLLARFTVSPPLAAATFSETVQESLPAPVIEEFVHDTALGVGIPVPLRGTVAVPPDEALLEIVNVPDAAPAAVGSNCT